MTTSPSERQQAAGYGRYPAHHRLPARRADPTVQAELQAAVDARRDLGPEYEGALVEGFVERLEETIDARVEHKLAQRSAAQPPAKQGMDGGQLALAIVSTALGVPLTGIAVVAGNTGVVGLVIVWIGIVVVNLAAAVSRRRH